jgi:hypothetical protein
MSGKSGNGHRHGNRNWNGLRRARMGCTGMDDLGQGIVALRKSKP